ncbi:hypothetical protein JOL62DRAFT_223011 [Phyllosticta paracitricarpa]|uniref:Uncharacterized protein n=1 Tax=Phyllosticta paracitricarpa TaxID=2016321 RepID=A0ABR1MZT3_9PEZI
MYLLTDQSSRVESNLVQPVRSAVQYSQAPSGLSLHETGSLNRSLARNVTHRMAKQSRASKPLGRPTTPQPPTILAPPQLSAVSRSSQCLTACLYGTNHATSQPAKPSGEQSVNQSRLAWQVQASRRTRSARQKKKGKQLSNFVFSRCLAACLPACLLSFCLALRRRRRKKLLKQRVNRQPGKLIGRKRQTTRL